MNDIPATEMPNPSAIGPRAVSVSTVIFKTLAGLGTGFLGTILLLIFVGIALAISASGMQGPFMAFTALIMGLIVSLVTNSLSVLAFSQIDRNKYPSMRPLLRHITSLNIVIFLFLVPVYAIASVRDIQTIFLVLSLQLALSAQASAFVLELSAAKNSRENMLAVYGVTFGMLMALLINGMVYAIAGYATSGVSETTARFTSGGSTILLFFILPMTWMFFGFFTTLVEIVYRWIYTVWGVDYLNNDN